jgi:sarcosine oxidase
MPYLSTLIVAAGFSGHGYKFCAAIGEILADLSDGTTAHDTHLFRLSRPALDQPALIPPGANAGQRLAER